MFRQQIQSVFLVLCFLVVVHVVANEWKLWHYSGPTAHMSTTKSASNVYYNGSHYISNRWYGWQPETKSPMVCLWAECLKENHTCETCRDSPEDMAVSNSSSLDPGKDWIPDVSMLRRMYLDGHDANGNPWPPPLDDDLCHLFNNSQSTKKLLDEAHIVGAPISKRPETKNNKLFCFIYTMEKRHANSIRAMRETWAPGCDGFLAFSTKSDPRIPAISIPHRGRERYSNMWQKVRSIFQFVGKHYLSQFDWFYMGGDDLVVYPQNLKNYLESFNSSQPHYVGRRIKTRNNVRFNTGGPGYALTRPALQCLLEHLWDSRCEPRKETFLEDQMTGICLEYCCNITYEDTRDVKKRERFHLYGPEYEYNYRGERRDYNSYHKEWGLKKGKDSCSPESINFHYIRNPGMARYLFHYVQDVQGCNRSI